MQKLTKKDAPDTIFAGYTVNLIAGYRYQISGPISGQDRILDILPDT
jgi:hypothetical protein